MNIPETYAQKLGLSKEDLRNIRTLRVAASISEMAQPEATSLYTRLATADLGSSMPPVVEGKPRMLHATAFIVHEGVNLNRNGFVAEELLNAVQSHGLFRPPYGGMLDVNHGLDPVGFWYDSEFRYDPEAARFGILAHGAIWAWRYPDIAAKLLSDQDRDGKAVFSMMVLSNRVEYAPDEFGATVEWLHNPVFLGATVLIDTSPGDPMATGFVMDEGHQLSEEERAMMRAGALTTSQDLGDELMDIEALKAALSEVLGEKSSELSDAFDAAVADITSKLDTKEATIQALTDEKDSLSTEVGELKSALAEKDVALQALADAKTALDTEVSELKDQLAVYAQKEEEARVAALRTERQSQLSEGVRARLAALTEEVRESIWVRWLAQDEAAWEVTKAEQHLTDTTTTTRGVGLPNAAPGAKTSPLDAFLR